MKNFLIISFLLLLIGRSQAQSVPDKVPDAQMQKIYDEVKTPYKYGLVMVPPSDSKKMDCPSVFRKNDTWYMTYLVFDGRGYETWIAKSANLLDWVTLGRILSFSNDSTQWDADQKAGYIALQDYSWGGSYELQKFRDRYWMSYIGGKTKGYELGLLSIGIATNASDPADVNQWNPSASPVMMSTDTDVRWWENIKQFKSTVIRDQDKLTGHPFVMFYNAAGDSFGNDRNAERIGMAVSDDMEHWKRFLKDPVLDHHRGITGDPVIQKIGNTWVMFYFGAFWQKDGKDGAFNRFACSYDLVNWTDWKGENLVEPSEPYDNLYAHKSFVVKWNNVVYHFYCAVNNKDQRGIAVATSKDLGKSYLAFVQEKNLSELILDKYSISKKTPENAKAVSLSIRLKNKDSRSHNGSLKVEIGNSQGGLFFRNEKKIALDTGKVNEFSYELAFDRPDIYSIHYTYSDESGQILEKKFSWETKPVNFFYSFAAPHRLTIALPDNSNKTLLDLYKGKLNISWTYDNLVYYPYDAFRVPRTDWKLSIQPLINDIPFIESTWERSEGYLPVLKNSYTDKDATVILEVSGADSAAIVKIILVNKSNISQRIKIPVVCPGGWKGYNPGWIDNTLPTDYLLAGWNAPADKIIVLGIGADRFPVDTIVTTQMNMEWEIEPGETRTAWLIRPYNSFARDAARLKNLDWEKKFNQSKETWKTLIGRSSRLLIPDSGIVNGFYASLSDIFIMREPIGKGYIGVVPGTEVYRSCPSDFEPAIATVALDQMGLHEDAELGFRVSWDLQTANGDWSEPGGWGHLMWGGAGYKAWSLMEHFYNTRDTAFLKKRYPQMLACSKWQDKERQKTRQFVNGEKSLTYGLMPAGMGDGGLMNGNSYYGIFYTHNIWAVFEDSLAYCAALLLNREEDAKELKGIYERSKSDLITAMERGAIIGSDGKRRLSSLPGKNSGSCWGLLSAIFPTGILPKDHELMNNTLQYVEKRMSPGGIPVHTGWMADGMWVAISLNDFAEAHLVRNEGDAANALLYATMNHGTPFYTWCEERGQDPASGETTGDLQHLWTPVAVVRYTRDMMLMEEGNTLHLLRGIARGWLVSGENVGIENASSHFGDISFKISLDKNKSQLKGDIHFPKENQHFETILHCPLPGKLKVVKASGATVLPDGSGIKFDQCAGDITFTATVR